jgi:hypothetical protein
MDEVKGLGRVVFAASLLTIGSVLNIIYGIAGISNSHFYTQHANYVFGDLKTWGWVTLIIGILEGFAALSLFAGGAYGRWFAIIAGSLAAIGALLDIPAAPFWSLCMFGLSLYIVSGVVQYGRTRPFDDGYAEPAPPARPRQQTGAR